MGIKAMGISNFILVVSQEGLSFFTKVLLEMKYEGHNIQFGPSPSYSPLARELCMGIKMMGIFNSILMS